METKKLFKGLVIVILSLFFMACGNNEAAKTETTNGTQENMVSPPADSTNIKKDADATKDSTSARKEKDEDEEKENGKVKVD